MVQCFNDSGVWSRQISSGRPSGTMPDGAAQGADPAGAVDREPFDAAPSSPSGERRSTGSWALPLACSMALHLLLGGLLLGGRLQNAPPALAVPQVITLSLVDFPAAGPMPGPAVSPPPPTPVKPKAIRRPAVVRTRRPQKAAPTAEPRPGTPAAETAASAAPDAGDGPGPDTSAATVVSASGSGSGNGDGGAAGSGDVQVSVPLYDFNPPPVYPPAARRRNLEGTVVLKVLVDEAGQAAQVTLLRGSGHALLDRSAIDSVRTWRFAPGRRLGRPQAMWVQVPVRFRLQ